jgi:hypothetical protein
MPAPPVDQLIAQLKARGLTVETASGGPATPAAEDSAPVELQQPGPPILRVTSDTINVTVPATAGALGWILANCDRADANTAG